ncbi:hypothetical protein SAMN04487966_108146 [Micrococcus terreus]|uniref:Uncharacterized protein n=1 Tax=Micrococcus terreus TaxID=574650 RepID=A0A1I7MPH8_9MICC|nr:hypothetical protein SAMN04487966_108146 [Micrococcus terreus]
MRPSGVSLTAPTPTDEPVIEATGPAVDEEFFADKTKTQFIGVISLPALSDGEPPTMATSWQHSLVNPPNFA